MIYGALWRTILTIAPPVELSVRLAIFDWQVTSFSFISININGYFRETAIAFA